MLDAGTLRRLWPAAPAALVEAIAAHAAATFARFGLTTRLRVVHFLAQISHESGGGTVTAENLNYTSAARIAAVWPTRFTPASAQPYVGNPGKLADAVYNGRMGNAPGSDDGFNYRGRGLLQITGRASYRAIGAAIGLPLETRPELAAAPSVALDVAAAEFKSLGCLPFCDADNVQAVTRRVNGGYTGLASRQAWLQRWKAALPDYATEPAPDAPSAPVHATEAPADAPPPVEIPRGSDEVLPPGVEHPGKTMAQSKTGWAAIAGTVTAIGETLGQAMDSLRPLFADPRTVALVLAVILAAGAFIWFDRRRKLRSDHV